MSECTCAARGYCPTLGIHTTEHLRKLCQRDHAKAIAVAARLNSSADKDNAISERHNRIGLAKARNDRRLGWVRGYRIPEDKGVGDTIARLLGETIVSKHGATDAAAWLRYYLKIWSCKTCDAVDRLNKQHPY